MSRNNYNNNNKALLKDFLRRKKKSMGKDNMSIYFQICNEYPIIDNKEIKKLKKTKQLDLIVLHNMRFAISMAKKYENIGAELGLELCDLVSEGIIGLILAAKVYDIKFNNKFTTFAYHYVNREIIRAITNKARLVRYPEHSLYQKFKSQEKPKITAKSKNIYSRSE